MTDAILVRAAVPGDATALAALTAAIHALHLAARPDIFKPASAADFEPSVAERLQAGAAQIVVAEIAGRLVGQAVTIDEHRAENVYLHARRWCEIQQLGVHPDHRRRGIAGHLVRHIVASAAARGISVVELTTWPFNQAAREAFQRLGFVVKSTRHELSVG